MTTPRAWALCRVRVVRSGDWRGRLSSRVQRALLLWFASIWILNCSCVGFSRKPNLVEYENENENEPRASVHVGLEASRTVASSFTASRRAEHATRAHPPLHLPSSASRRTARHGAYIHTPRAIPLEWRSSGAWRSREAHLIAHTHPTRRRRRRKEARARRARQAALPIHALYSSPANFHARLRAGTPGDPPTARSRLAAHPTLQFNSKTTIALFSLGARA